MHDKKEMAEGCVNSLQPIENPAKDSTAQNVAPQAETVKPEEPKALDPMRFCPLRSWSTKEERDVTRCLLRTVAKDQFRYNITGIHIDGDAGIATNGHRLLVVRGFARGMPTGQTMAVEGGRLVPRLIEGNFPDWRAVIPKTFKHTFLIERFQRMRALKSYAPLCINKDGLSLDPFQEIASFNMQFLADLPGTDDEVLVSVTDSLSPILFRAKAGGWMAILMPLRVGGDFIKAMPCDFEGPL